MVVSIYIVFRFKDGILIPQNSMSTISFAKIIRTQFGRYHCSAISGISNGTSGELLVNVYCKCYLLVCFNFLNEIISDIFSRYLFKGEFSTEIVVLCDALTL